MPIYVPGEGEDKAADDANATASTVNTANTQQADANATQQATNATANSQTQPQAQTQPQQQAQAQQQPQTAFAKAWSDAINIKQQANNQQQTNQQVPPNNNWQQNQSNQNQGANMNNPNPNASTYSHQTIVDALYAQQTPGNAEEIIQNLKLMFGNQTSINQVDERTAGIYKLLEEIRVKYGDGASDSTIKYLTAPAGKLQLPYSGIVICKVMPIENGNKIVVGTHLLIVETNTPLHPRKKTIAGVEFSIPVTAGELYSEATDKAVCEIVTNHYRAGLKNQSVDILHSPCSYTVVPHEIDINNPENIAQIANHATQAILTTMDIRNGEISGKQGTMIANAMQSNLLGNYVNVVNHPAHQIEDFTGAPIRADWTLESTIINKSQNQNDLNNYSANSRLSLGKIAVFNQPRYAQPEITYNQLTGQHQPVRSQHYYNEVVIKEVVAGPQTRLTLSSLLILIASATVLTQNGSWKLAYMPNKSIPYEDVDMRDIGAFGYECEFVNAKNDGKPPKKEKFNTKTSTFDNLTFENYMNSLFNQEVIFKIDVPDGHYLLNMFNIEASNSDTGKVIRSIIYKTLDSMTDAKFSKQMGKLLTANNAVMNDTIFLDRERILCGYYLGETNKNGTVQRINKPLDNLDYLALLNLINGDARIVQELEKSQQNGMDELAEGHRATLIEQLTGSSYQVKSKGTRLTFNPLFITAMTNAFKEAGIFPSTNGYLNNQSTWVRPTYEDLSRFAVNPANLAVAQNAGFSHGSGNQVHMPYMATGFGSW